MIRITNEHPGRFRDVADRLQALDDVSITPDFVKILVLVLLVKLEEQAKRIDELERAVQDLEFTR